MLYKAIDSEKIMFIKQSTYEQMIWFVQIILYLNFNQNYKIFVKVMVLLDNYLALFYSCQITYMHIFRTKSY